MKLYSYDELSTIAQERAFDNMTCLWFETDRNVDDDQIEVELLEMGECFTAEGDVVYAN